MDNHGWFEPSPRKTVRIGLPKSIQYSLIWTLFFSIIGILIQFFESKVSVFPENLINFFMTNYIAWFNSFGNFTSINFYYSTEDLIFSMLEKWYYFFLTGGIISLLWSILSWIIHFEINVKVQPIEEKIALGKLQISQHSARINNLVAEGMKALAESNKKGAETIYLQAKQEYKKELDPLRESYNILINFYQELLKNR